MMLLLSLVCIICSDHDDNDVDDRWDVVVVDKNISFSLCVVVVVGNGSSFYVCEYFVKWNT